MHLLGTDPNVSIRADASELLEVANLLLPCGAETSFNSR